MVTNVYWEKPTTEEIEYLKEFKDSLKYFNEFEERKEKYSYEKYKEASENLIQNFNLK